MLSPEDGKFLVEIARKAIETYLKDSKVLKVPENIPNYLKENMGAFVTLNRREELRGCIGYPEPVKPLIDAVIDAAISAATRDPRFPEVSLAELDDLEVEVSVLTTPQLLEVEKPAEYLDKIKIGEDGLIVEMDFHRGLLLPQVPLDWNWNVEEFLDHTCLKAGLPAECWLAPKTKIYHFKSQIFQE
jgi:uncharacterized protein (TIGR00296 family)